MNGYMIHHEIAINRQAAALQQLAAEYQQIINEAESIKRIPGWTSEAADIQRVLMRKIVEEARGNMQELQSISRDLYAFTASHKTWLEDGTDMLKNLAGRVTW